VNAKLNFFIAFGKFVIKSAQFTFYVFLKSFQFTGNSLKERHLNNVVVFSCNVRNRHSSVHCSKVL